MEEVELHQAFFWTCNQCGKDNFIYAVTVRLSEEQVQEVVKERGGTEDFWRNGAYLQTPNKVTCKFCSAQYKSVDD